MKRIFFIWGALVLLRLDIPTSLYAETYEIPFFVDPPVYVKITALDVAAMKYIHIKRPTHLTPKKKSGWLLQREAAAMDFLYSLSASLGVKTMVRNAVNDGIQFMVNTLKAVQSSDKHLLWDYFGRYHGASDPQAFGRQYTQVWLDLWDALKNSSVPPLVYTILTVATLYQHDAIIAQALNEGLSSLLTLVFDPKFITYLLKEKNLEKYTGLTHNVVDVFQIIEKVHDFFIQAIFGNPQWDLFRMAIANEESLLLARALQLLLNIPGDQPSDAAYHLQQMFLASKTPLKKIFHEKFQALQTPMAKPKKPLTTAEQAAPSLAWSRRFFLPALHNLSEHLLRIIDPKVFFESTQQLNTFPVPQWIEAFSGKDLTPRPDDAIQTEFNNFIQRLIQAQDLYKNNAAKQIDFLFNTPEPIPGITAPSER